MHEFDCLSKKTKILGQHLLEASAGTGKTFAIEHLFVRFLLEKKFLIENILVMTFTNAAASELKERLFCSLKNAIDILEVDQVPKLDYLIPYQGNNEAVFLLKKALLGFDEAQIFTIHGFCHRMLQEYAYETNTLFTEQEFSEKQIADEVILDFLRYRMKDNSHPLQIKSILKKAGGIDNLCQLLRSPGEKANTRDFFAIYTDFCHQVASFDNEADFENLSKDYKTLYPLFKLTGYTNKNTFDTQIEVLKKSLLTKKVSEQDFSFLLDTGMSVVSFLRKENLKKGKQNSTIPSVFSQIEKKLYLLIEEVMDPKNTLSIIKRDLSPILEQELKTKGVYGPDQILEKMEKMSFDRSFCAKLKNRYSAVIIDEFQDTDKKQWNIFENLFLQKKSSIKAFYLVGDPKQSIYRFRKADLYTYLQAQKKLGDDAIYHLSYNYRGCNQLIDSLNSLFSSPFIQNWLELPKLNSSLPYHPVKVGNKELSAIDDDYSAMHFFMGKGKTVKNIEEEKFFPFIAHEINRLQNQQNLCLKDFAVLVKDRYQAKKLQDYFSNIGIAYKTRSSSSLLDSIAFKALEEFFQAVLFFPDKNFMKIAMAGPFIQADSTQIDTIDPKVFEMFDRLKNTFEKKGLSYFFSAFLYDYPTLESLCRDKDLSIYKDTMQIIDLMLKQKVKNCLFAVFNFFETCRKLSPNDLKKSILTDKQGVEISTIHMSKGLEYEVVFALGLSSASKQAKDIPIEEIEEVDAEKMRQLYVAMTRAKKRVYVPFCFLDKKQNGSISPIDLFFQKASKKDKPLDKETFLEKIQTLEDRATYSFIEEKIFVEKKQDIEKVVLQNPKQFTKTLSTSYVTSFSHLVNYVKHPLKQIPADILPAGPVTGDILHRILEKVFIDKNKRENLRFLIKEQIVSTILENHEEEIFSIIQKASSLNLPGDIVLDKIGLENLQVEMEFCYPLSKQCLIKGFIDLCFCHNNTYYLLDWKSNYIEDGYEHESLEKVMIEHEYDLQASIYYHAINKYIHAVDPKASIGGIYYIFLRGLEENKGIYFLKNVKTEQELNLCLEKSKKMSLSLIP